MSRIVDTLIVFRILKMLTTPFEKTDAFKLGMIDKKGNRIKDKKPETKKEKDRYDGALRRRQLSLILSGRMKADDASELKALFTKN